MKSKRPVRSRPSHAKSMLREKVKFHQWNLTYQLNLSHKRSKFIPTCQRNTRMWWLIAQRKLKSHGCTRTPKILRKASLNWERLNPLSHGMKIHSSSRSEMRPPMVCSLLCNLHILTIILCKSHQMTCGRWLCKGFANTWNWNMKSSEINLLTSTVKRILLYKKIHSSKVDRMHGQRFSLNSQHRLNKT